MKKGNKVNTEREDRETTDVKREGSKVEIEEDTEEFLLEKDNQGLYLGKEQFLLEKEGLSPESIVPEKKKRVLIAGIFGYLIMLAVFGIITYAIFNEVSTALIVVGAIIAVSIIIFVIYKKKLNKLK